MRKDLRLIDQKSQALTCPFHGFSYEGDSGFTSYFWYRSQCHAGSPGFGPICWQSLYVTELGGHHLVQGFVWSNSPFHPFWFNYLRGQGSVLWFAKINNLFPWFMVEDFLFSCLRSDPPAAAQGSSSLTRCIRQMVLYRTCLVSILVQLTWWEFAT